MDFNLKHFYALGLASALMVQLTGFSVGHYPTQIILIYILMTIYTAYHYRSLGSMRAVSLGFLLVFINSYFWEFPLHLENLLMGGNMGVQLVQALHLISLPFLLKRVKYDLIIPDKMKILNICLNVFIFTCVMVWITQALPNHGYMLLNHISRIFSLWNLINIFGLIKPKFPEAPLIGDKIG